ncbi:hypothetical protein M513_11167 [Trichuris suis]|uniref:Uncharacterized protein n=1 Tax=Trichuris suis TaxID=68888 RepID=A0A085LSI8_9BILA|nr:hypothetical protein M513_11167 [Trichuris suis]
MSKSIHPLKVLSIREVRCYLWASGKTTEIFQLVRATPPFCMPVNIAKHRVQEPKRLQLYCFCSMRRSACCSNYQAFKSEFRRVLQTSASQGGDTTPQDNAKLHLVDIPGRSTVERGRAPCSFSGEFSPGPPGSHCGTDGPGKCKAYYERNSKLQNRQEVLKRPLKRGRKKGENAQPLRTDSRCTQTPLLACLPFQQQRRSSATLPSGEDVPHARSNDQLQVDNIKGNLFSTKTPDEYGFCLLRHSACCSNYQASKGLIMPDVDRFFQFSLGKEALGTSSVASRANMRAMFGDRTDYAGCRPFLPVFFGKRGPRDFFGRKSSEHESYVRRPVALEPLLTSCTTPVSRDMGP